MGSADGHRLLASLPPDTAASVLGWLSSRGRDLPTHIPLKTVRFSRECFALIDADGSGTLDARELQAVFRALGRPASLRQVQGLLEQVAGPHAAHLTFTQFAMLMHGAASGSGPQEEGASPRGARAGGWHRSAGGASPRRGASERRGRPAAAAAGGGGGREGEEELSWSDFHLLAKAFRRRVVVDGVIGNKKGWRDKVLALAERQAHASRASAVSAATLWKHRAQRLQQRMDASAAGGAGGAAGSAADGSRLGTPAGPGAAGPGSRRGSGVGREEASDVLDGAVSTGTPRELSGVVVDAASEGSAPHSALAAARPGGGASAQAGEAQASGAQRQVSSIAAKLMSRLRSNAAAASASIGGGASSEAQAAAALRTVSGGAAGGSRPGSGLAPRPPPYPLSRPGSAAISAAAAAAGLPGGQRTASLLRPGQCLSTLGPASIGGGGLPAIGAALSSEGAEAEAEAAAGGRDQEEEAAEGAEHLQLPRGQMPPPPPSGQFEWRRSAMVMHQAAAASRAALGGPPEAKPAAGGSATPRPGAPLGAASRLLSGTASSRARTAPAGAPAAAERTSRSSAGPRTAVAGASGGGGGRRLGRAGSLKEQLWGQAAKPAARAQRTHLEAVQLMKGQQLWER